MAPVEKMQYQTTKILRFGDCVGEYVNQISASEEWSDINPRFSDSKKFCTKNAKGKGLCIGDAGSPLVAHNKLIGVASWSSYCAHDLPDVYTNVYANLDWIETEMKT